LSDIYEGSNSPRWLKLAKDIDKINERVGLSCPNFETIRFKMIPEEMLKRMESAIRLADTQSQDAVIDQAVARTSEEKGLAGSNPVIPTSIFLIAKSLE
jgi:hypothetical protein